VVGTGVVKGSPEEEREFEQRRQRNREELERMEAAEKARRHEALARKAAEEKAHRTTVKRLDFSGVSEGMHAVTDLADFINQVGGGPAYLRTSIRSIAACVGALSNHLLQTLRTNPIQLLAQDFRGICPHCSGWVEQNTLGMVWSLSHQESSKVIMTSYGNISRLRDGHCTDANCPSEEIVLIWKGSQRIKNQVLDHLERLRQYAGARNDAVLPRYLERLARPDILNFVTDTIEALEARQKRGGDEHLCKGQRRDDFVVWVSATPVTMQNARKFISGEFLKRLLRASEYDAGLQAFAHWVSAADLLNLALLPEKKLDPKDRFCILPAELLSEAERAELAAGGAL
jgi:hypothetical protein